MSGSQRSSGNCGKGKFQRREVISFRHAGMKSFMTLIREPELNIHGSRRKWSNISIVFSMGEGMFIQGGARKAGIIRNVQTDGAESAHGTMGIAVSAWQINVPCVAGSH